MSVEITKAERDEYYSVQKSGKMNMWGHPLIVKFGQECNWKAAYDHFENKGNESTLVLDLK